MSDTTQDPAPAGGDNLEPSSGGGESGHNGPDPNALAAELRKTKKLLKQQEQQIAKFSQLEEERKQSELTEIERYKKQAEEAQSLLQRQQAQFAEAQKRNAFTMAAHKAGVTDPEAAMRLADLSGIELSEDGSVSGVETALKELKSKYPSLNLFGAAETPASSSGGNPSGGAPKVTEKDIMNMSPEQFQKWCASQL